jgi:hypothetical protein
VSVSKANLPDVKLIPNAGGQRHPPRTPAFGPHLQDLRGTGRSTTRSWAIHETSVTGSVSSLIDHIAPMATELLVVMFGPVTAPAGSSMTR